MAALLRTGNWTGMLMIIAVMTMMEHLVAQHRQAADLMEHYPLTGVMIM